MHTKAASGIGRAQSDHIAFTVSFDPTLPLFPTPETLGNATLQHHPAPVTLNAVAHKGTIVAPQKAASRCQ